MKETAHRFARRQRFQRRSCAAAFVLRQCAAVHKCATCARPARSRRPAIQRDRQARIAQFGDRGQQPACIRVHRCFQNLTRAAFQHNFARVHHHDAVTDPRDGPQIVADVDHRHTPIARNIAQQFKDVGLRCHIQTGGWFVQQQGMRFTRQCHRNGHPLLLPAREFVGKPRQDRGRVRQAHLPK